MRKFFEDIRIGEQNFLGSHDFTADAIIAFAKRYDPQSFHIDEAAGKASFYGGLIASGWHSASVGMRLWVDHLQSADETPYAKSLGVEALPVLDQKPPRQPRPGPSPGLKNLRWHTPVRPDDTVTYSVRVMKKTELKSRPQWGLVVNRFSGINQRNIEAISFEGQVFVERRSGGQNN